MSTLTVTAKGQVTFRKDLLKHLGVHPGDRLLVEKLPDGRLEVRSGASTGRIEDVFGLLARPGAPTLSIEAMNGIIAEGWAGKR